LLVNWSYLELIIIYKMSRQQKNKKPRVYDLNQDPEEIIVSEPKKSVSKKSRKYDFNDIIDDDL